MAEQVLDVVERVGVDRVVVQCEAGRSRSAGLAAALGKIYNDDDWFIFDNAKYNPNRYVYRTMLNAYQRRVEAAPAGD